MVHPTILHQATVLKRKSEESIKKEVALNLLKDLLAIFIRVTLFPSPMINNKRTRFIKIGYRPGHIEKHSNNKHMHKLCLTMPHQKLFSNSFVNRK